MMILCDIIYFSKIENRVIKVRKYIDKEVVAVSKEYEMKWKEKAVTKERGSVKGNVLISGIIICRNEFCTYARTDCTGRVRDHLCCVSASYCSGNLDF